MTFCAGTQGANRPQGKWMGPGAMAEKPGIGEGKTHHLIKG